MKSRNQMMTNEMKAARRAVGIAKFERECGCDWFTGFDGRRRWTKRYRIPGTAEHGRYAMLQRYVSYVFWTRFYKSEQLRGDA